MNNRYGYNAMVPLVRNRKVTVQDECGPGDIQCCESASLGTDIGICASGCEDNGGGECVPKQPLPSSDDDKGCFGNYQNEGCEKIGDDCSVNKECTDPNSGWNCYPTMSDCNIANLLKPTTTWYSTEGKQLYKSMLSSMIDNAAKQKPPVSSKIANCIVNTLVKNRTPYQAYNIDDSTMNQITSSCMANPSNDPGPPSLITPTPKPTPTPTSTTSTPDHRKLIILISVIVATLLIVISALYLSRHNPKVQMMLVAFGLVVILVSVYMMFKPVKLF